jgi:pilus assembly protein CpaE
LVETFQTVLGESADVLPSVDNLRRHLEERPQEYAVVLGPSVDLATATAFADTVRITRPSLSMILMRRRIDTAVLGEALRAGLREVVEERDLTGLGRAVHRAYALWQAMTDSQGGGAQRGHLFTVFGTKGGVGKSTLSTNLAAALADHGQLQVCLVDLDLASGDVAIMLQLFPSNTLADLATMTAGLDPAMVKSLITPHSERLSVLAAPVQPDAKDHVSAETVGRLLQMLTSTYDVVVVDTSSAFDDFSLQSLDHSDIVLLIGTLDIPALKSLKLATETLDLLNISRSRWRLVLNRADSKVGLSPAEVEDTLKLSIATSIPSTREIPASINRGKPIVRVDPRHPASQSIRALARDLVVSVRQGRSPAPAEHARERRRGLLRRKVRQP